MELNDEQFHRYARHLILDEVGEDAGQFLLDALRAGAEQDDALHHDEIARLHRLHGQLAEAGPGKDGFHDHRPGEELRDLER